MTTPESGRSPAVLYVDVDGTLVGPGGSLFAGPHGPSGAAADALAALHAAGVDLVLVSGRSRPQMSEAARLLGASAYVAELGGLLVEARGGREEALTNFGRYAGRGRPVDAMARSGAAAFLLERYAGRLELHAPWALRPREVTMLFRGLVDEDEAADALRGAGYGWLDLRDNGVLRGRYPGLEVEPAHVYHLAPRGVTKASALRLHRERHGIDRAEAVAVGDSPSDLEMAPEVRTLFLVGAVVPPVGAPGNIRMLAGGPGAGFAEAVGSILR